MAVVCEKSQKVYFKYPFIVLFKSDLGKEGLVRDLSLICSGMDTAQIDEIKRAASHNEQRVPVVEVRGGREVVDYTALICELELTNTCKSVIDLR